MIDEFDPLTHLWHQGASLAYDPDVPLPTVPDNGLEGPVKADTPRPDRPRPALASMLEAWELPDDLLGGTRRMQKRCRRWLPRETREKERDYKERVRRSILWPLYADTLGTLAATPFEREVSWEEPAPDGMLDHLENVDGEGRTLTVWARDALFMSMHRGMVHAVVDSSSASGDQNDTSEARRVYWLIMDPRHVLDIDDDATPEGGRAVTYVRFAKLRTDRVPGFSFAHKQSVEIVELRKPIRDAKGNPIEVEGTRTVWKWLPETKQWLRGADVPYNPGKGGIPFFTHYTAQTGAYSALPPLEQLAELNLEHFQSHADQKHVLRYARLITLVTLGFKSPAPGTQTPQEKALDEVVLGPTGRIRGSDKEAKVAFLEPTGKGPELGFQDLDRIQDQAERLGARHLTTKTGQVTARALDIDNKKATSNLQAWCLRLDVFLKQCAAAHAAWLGTSLSATQCPHVYREFDAGVGTQEGAQGLQWLAKDGFLPPREVLVEAKRRKFVRADMDVDAVLAEREAEQAAALDREMALMAGTPGGPEGDPPDEDPPAPPPKKPAGKGGSAKAKPKNGNPAA